MNATQAAEPPRIRFWSRPLLITSAVLFLVACAVLGIGLKDANLNDTVVKLLTDAITKILLSGAVFAALTATLKLRQRGWEFVVFSLWCLILSSISVYNFHVGVNQAKARIQQEQQAGR